MSKIKGIIAKVSAVDKAAAHVDTQFKILKDELVGKLNQIKRKSVTTETSIDYQKMKSTFGKLFYGALVPINGVSSKNRRFKDGSWEAPDTWDDRKDLEGPCVWKKIGKMSGYSTRAHWYGYDQVFDGLCQKHVDLTIDGLRNRKDQRKTIKDLLRIRNDIKSLMDASNAGERDSGRSITLTESYPVEVVPLGEGHNGDKVPLDSVPGVIYKGEIKGVNIHFKVELEDKVRDYLKKSYEFNFSQGYHDSDTGTVILPLSDSVSEYPTVTYGWSNKALVLGIIGPYSDKNIDTSIQNVLSDRVKAAELVDKAQEKYAGRLLMKGVI